MASTTIGPKRRVIGEWRSLVAHLLWEQRVAGSNPVSPTTFFDGRTLHWALVIQRNVCVYAVYTKRSERSFVGMRAELFGLGGGRCPEKLSGEGKIDALALFIGAR